MAISNPLGPKYGEKGAQIKNYRQIHQPPVKLQRAMGNDRMCMEMCPSSGLHVDRLGDRADPLPLQRKRRYEQQKARTKAVKAGAIQSRKHQVEGRRKTVKKRKLSPVQNTTPPPEQPPPVLITFRSVPLPPAPQLATSENGTPIDALTVPSPIPPGRGYKSSHPMPPVTLRSCHSAGSASTAPELDYQPPQTANGVFNSTYLECYPGSPSGHSSDLALGHGLSLISTPSLQSDGGTPSTVESPRSPRSLGTWADGPTPSPQSPSLPEEHDRRPSATKEDTDSEDIFNAVYQSYFIPRPSWSHPSPTLTVEQGHSGTQSLSIIPETRSYYSFPSQPLAATISPPDARVPESWPTTTAVRSSTHQGHHSLSQYLDVPATTRSGVLSSHQHRGPAGKGAVRATGTQPGMHRYERAVFDRHHAPRPSPSYSDQVAAVHVQPNHSLAVTESSEITQSAGYGTILPIRGTVAHQAQALQHDGSTRISSSDSSHGHWGQPNSVPLACMIPAHLVNSVNQHQFSVPAMMSTQRSQPTRPFQSTYSDLADALVDPHSIVPLVGQGGVGEGIDYASLYIPQLGSDGIAGPATSAPGSLAHWQVDLSIAPQSVLNHPSMGSGIDVFNTLSTPRAHATDDDGITRILNGRLEERELSWPNIVAPLLCTDFANGQDSDETYLAPSSAGSHGDLRQQFLTTSMW